MRRAGLLATVTMTALLTLPASPAFAASPAFPASPAIAASARSVHSVHGAGVSSLPDDTRRLSVEGRLDGDGAARGKLSFTHLSRSGLARFTAQVTCVQFKAEGRVEVSGVVLRGQTAGGTALDGQPVAFTLDTAGAQHFSLPKFGAGAAGCGGGRPETVPVTQGGFRVR